MVEGDRERLRPIVDEALRPYLDLLRSPSDQNDKIIGGVTARMRRAGVSLTGSGLREAAQEYRTASIDLRNATLAGEATNEMREHVYQAGQALDRALSGESGEPKEDTTNKRLHDAFQEWLSEDIDDDPSPKPPFYLSPAESKLIDLAWELFPDLEDSDE